MMMTLRNLFLTGVAVGWMAILPAGAPSAQTGFAESGAKFLTIGGGARSLAMGETFVTETVDPFALFYNSAGLSERSPVRVGLAHNEYFQNSRGEYAALAVPAGRLSFGVAMRYFIVDDLPLRTGPSEQPLGFFDASDAELKGVVGYRISEDLRVGVGVKGIFEKIDSEVANGIALDLGAIYQVIDEVAVGLAINHAGPDMTYTEESYALPTTVRLGGKYATEVWSVRSEIVSQRSESADIHLGGEYVFLFPASTGGDDPLSAALRAGYIIGHDTRSWSAGAGLGIDRFRLSYAYVPYDDELGDTHRFGLQVFLR